MWCAVFSTLDPGPRNYGGGQYRISSAIINSTGAHGTRERPSERKRERERARNTPQERGAKILDEHLSIACSPVALTSRHLVKRRRRRSTSCRWGLCRLIEEHGGLFRPQRLRAVHNTIEVEFWSAGQEQQKRRRRPNDYPLLLRKKQQKKQANRHTPC